MRRNAALVAGLFVLLVGIAGFAGTTYFMHGAARQAQPSSVGGPFTLVDQDGKTVTDKDFAGQPFLVFFGYTNCPDVCPATLFEVSEAFNRLGADAAHIKALFVSVDPARDTPEVLQRYLSNFNPSIRGLTGSPAQIEAAAKAYRAYFAKAPGEGGDYSMDHTAVVYLMDAKGHFVRPLNTKSAPEQIAADIRPYLG